MTTKKSSTKKSGSSKGRAGKHEEAARLLVTLADHPGTPFYITSALCAALFEASGRADSPHRDREGQLDAEKIAGLLKATAELEFELEPEADAATLLSRIVKHKGLPDEIRYALGNAVTEELINQVDIDSPEVLRAALKLYMREDAR